MTDLRETLLNLALLPALWLSVGLGLACGVLFHLWRRGGWRRLRRDLLAGVIGFAVGHLFAVFAGNQALLLGQVQVIPGLIGALIILSISRALNAR